MDEATLIAHVVRLRAATEMTAKEVHAALTAEGATCTFGEVKKACSKASKQGLTSMEPVMAPTAAAVPSEKQAAKAAKAATSTMKAAESHMMDTCRRLRLAMGDDEYSAAVATSDRGEKFIQSVCATALEAKLPVEQQKAIKERVDADLATLEWMLLAEAAGTLNLPEDARKTAATQGARLKELRGASTVAEVEGAFIIMEPDEDPVEAAAGKPKVEYSRGTTLSRETTGAAIDRQLQKSGALSGALENIGIDDDVD